jgi:nucleotide-binding universal stress UspA family protein
VHAQLGSSTAADEVLGDGECRHARWMVVAAEGWRTPAWRRAPMSEQLSRHACAPVLAVRREAALVDWVRGRRRLLVMVGVDPRSSTSDSAVTFLRELRRVGPCDVLATYVCSPLEERARLGIHTPVHVEVLEPRLRNMEVLDPAVERVLQREGRVEVVLEPGYGRPADHLLHVAHGRGVDLVVVGTHARGGLGRLWHGSVSAGVLRHAEQSVVCVPPSVREPRPAVAPRSVLVPVDFSEASARAISQARSRGPRPPAARPPSARGGCHLHGPLRRAARAAARERPGAPAAVAAGAARRGGAGGELERGGRQRR